MNAGPPSRCPNCGSPHEGLYCSSCGQKRVVGRPTLRSLLGEGWIDLATWFETKLFRTLRLLVARPGELTCEYLRGRRVSYVGPFRLFVGVLAGVFFVGALVQPAETLSVPEAPELGEARLSQRLKAYSDVFDDLGKTLDEGDVGLSAHQLGTIKKVVGAATFLLVPWLAVLLRVADRDRKRFLPEHIVFSLHLHSFGLLAVGTVEILGELAPAAVQTGFMVLLPPVLWLHLVLALARVVPGLGLRGRVVRATVVSAFYLVTALAVMTLGALVALAG